jgi:hypothetical protein
LNEHVLPLLAPFRVHSGCGSPCSAASWAKVDVPFAAGRGYLGERIHGDADASPHDGRSSIAASPGVQLDVNPGAMFLYKRTSSAEIGDQRCRRHWPQPGLHLLDEARMRLFLEVVRPLHRHRVGR